MCLAAFLAGCQAPPPGLTEQDRQAIQAVSDSFTQRMMAGDHAGVAALYTSDGMVMPPNGPTVTGPAAIAQFMGGFPKMTSFQLANEVIEGRGDMAYIQGRYSMSMEGLAPDSGKYVEIRHRQADGTWPIAMDIFNSDVPLPPPPPARRAR